MKKLFILVLIVVLLSAFAGCSSDSDEPEPDLSENSVTVEEGVLRVGMDLQYPPFETFDDDGNPTGISVDVAQAFADKMELELEVVNMDFSTLIPALETGDIDIVIASMSITQEREEKVDFTAPYFYFKIIGLMNKEYADANSLSDESTAEDLWAIKDTRFVGLAGQISVAIPEEKGFDVKMSVDKSAAITEIVNAEADMLLISPEVVVGAHNANPNTTAVFWTPLEVSPIGMAVDEGNKELLELADEFIALMDSEGGVYDQLREKYSDTLEELYGDGFTMDFYIYE